MTTIHSEPLKPQWQMTKEDYARENRELRNYIDRLENQLDRQPDVFQEKH